MVNRLNNGEFQNQPWRGLASDWLYKFKTTGFDRDHGSERSTGSLRVGKPDNQLSFSSERRRRRLYHCRGPNKEQAGIVPTYTTYATVVNGLIAVTSHDKTGEDGKGSTGPGT
ncbi:hypothetical protein FB451DRAFT_1182513 [Mycena latifolia]|nr:hypothetical protein FB451DRAFT_1182513 [Mycena latifolia]